MIYEIGSDGKWRPLGGCGSLVIGWIIVIFLAFSGFGSGSILYFILLLLLAIISLVVTLLSFFSIIVGVKDILKDEIVNTEDKYTIWNLLAALFLMSLSGILFYGLVNRIIGLFSE